MENQVKSTFKTNIQWYIHKEYAPSKDKRPYLVITLAGWITVLEYNAEHNTFAWSDEFQSGIDVQYWAEIPDEIIKNAKIMHDGHVVEL